MTGRRAARLLAGALAATTLPAAQAASDPPPLDPESVARGAPLYAEHCAACHGTGLEGQPGWQTPGPDGTMAAPPHDDSGHTWHHPDSLLTDYVRLGGAETLRQMGVAGMKSGMPGFGGTLSDREIRDVLDYIRSSWSPRMRAYQWERSRDGG